MNISSKRKILMEKKIKAFQQIMKLFKILISNIFGKNVEIS